jgi:hypothetical protein
MMPEHGHGAPIPILPVRDVDLAADLWEVLVLGVVRYDEGCAFVTFAGHQLLQLRVVPTRDPTRTAASMYLHREDVVPWVARLARVGLDADGAVEQPRAMRSIAVTGRRPQPESDQRVPRGGRRLPTTRSVSTFTGTGHKGSPSS